MVLKPTKRDDGEDSSRSVDESSDGRERYETREDCTTDRFGLKSLQGIPHGLSSVQLFLIGTALKCLLSY